MSISSQRNETIHTCQSNEIPLLAASIITPSSKSGEVSLGHCDVERTYHAGMVALVVRDFSVEHFPGVILKDIHDSCI